MILNNQDEIKKLSLNSHVIIKTKCDICQKIGKTSYKNYNRNTKNQTGQYCCSNRCAHNSGKIKKTNIKKYGGNSPSSSAKIKEKQKQAKIKKYGDGGYNNRDKAKETNLKKFNCEHPMQNYELHEKQQLSGKKIKLHEQTGLYYRGSYEKDFLDYCFNNKIKVEKASTIKYEFENKNKIYYPDFYLKEKNLIIEIKSIYTYKKYLDKNIAKENSCKKQGYNYIFIIDKHYEKFKNII